MKIAREKGILFLAFLLFVLPVPLLRATDVGSDPVLLVKQQLQLDSRIQAAHIQVGIKGNKVILAGVVASLAEKQLVEEIAKRIMGEDYSIAGLNVVPPPVPDLEIQRAIAASIPAHCQIQIHDFTAEVKEGKVVLKGRTDALHHRVLAEHAVSNIRGVKSVANQILVVGNRTSDALIRENILSVLDSYFKENGIGGVRVSVSDGKVTLNGTVENYDQERYIKESAEKVAGVVSVKEGIFIRRPSREIGRWGK